jgi:hypothetical protein
MMDKKIDKWIRITKELKAETLENPDPDLSKDTKFWLQTKYMSSNTASGYDYHSYSYIIRNSLLEETSIKEQNLECLGIHDNYAYGQGLSIIFVIKDYNGEINNYEE